MVFKKISSFFWFWILQLEVNYGVYMLEPWEKQLFYSVLILILAMSTYTTYAFLPRYTRSMMAYFWDTTTSRPYDINN